MEQVTWNSVKDILNGILDRQWYTNHGPLQRQLEERLSEMHDVPHCITVTNYAIAEKLLAKLFPEGCSAAHVFKIGDVVAYIVTDDDDVADKIRTIRSSYGMRRKMDVPVGGYGRVSEIQAGLALKMLGA